MLIWPALLLAPTIVLADLSIAYALLQPACASGNSALLHAVALTSLALTLVFTLMAWRAARSDAPLMAQGSDGDDAVRRRHFLASVAMWTGALSCLVVIAQWIPQWLLSPCVS